MGTKLCLGLLSSSSRLVALWELCTFHHGEAHCFPRDRSWDTSSAPALQLGLANIITGTDKYELHFQETKKPSPAQIFWESSRRKVFRMHDVVIKFGPGVDAREAQTMQFIKETIKIPVPNAANDGSTVMLMDYIDGCNLKECWP